MKAVPSRAREINGEHVASKALSISIAANSRLGEKPGIERRTENWEIGLRVHFLPCPCSEGAWPDTVALLQTAGSHFLIKTRGLALQRSKSDFPDTAVTRTRPSESNEKSKAWGSSQMGTCDLVA